LNQYLKLLLLYLSIKDVLGDLRRMQLRKKKKKVMKNRKNNIVEMIEIEVPGFWKTTGT
jgi:hypothetical protein